MFCCHLIWLFTGFVSSVGLLHCCYLVHLAEVDERGNFFFPPVADAQNHSRGQGEPTICLCDILS